MSFTLRTDEHSKDSQSHLIEIAISDGVIHFTERRTIFAEVKEESWQDNLDGRKTARILDFLGQNRFDQEIKESKRTGSPGVAISLNVVIRQPFSAHILIAGQSHIWGSDEYIAREWGRECLEQKSNLDNFELIRSAENFVAMIRLMFRQPKRF